MAIKSGVSLGVVDVLTTDTVLFEQGSIAGIQRYAVEACSLHNTSVTTISSIEIYESSDLTSVSGSVVAVYSINPNQSKDVLEIIGQGFKDKNLIIKAGSTGLNALTTVTTYNDGD